MLRDNREFVCELDPETHYRFALFLALRSRHFHRFDRAGSECTTKDQCDSREESRDHSASLDSGVGVAAVCDRRSRSVS
jgi:hypothetical protein